MSIFYVGITDTNWFSLLREDYNRMSIPDAWDKFGRGNGRESLEIMQKSLKGMQEKINTQSSVEDRLYYS